MYLTLCMPPLTPANPSGASINTARIGNQVRLSLYQWFGCTRVQLLLGTRYRESLVLASFEILSRKK
ncbi:hypothetical protein L6164_006278 [Bauhinia variegata]|uniref:Uncharacterized protein n=1 Tax=Bauhinia variegata TaxID=167791 RepID=A0ACB9PU09_BAUVA|nr:hypothetical protein L6164_006278 [Bauhinia variegata]